MIALLSIAFATEGAVPPVAVQAVFATVPEKNARLKAIRYAMRKQPTLIGGRDWGRVVCFEFRGERDTAVLERALAKVKLEAELREAESCQVPPQEAFLPPDPVARRLVRFPEPPTAETLRSEVAALVDLDLGLSAIRIQDGVVDRVCLEFERAPDDEAVQFALSALTFDTSPLETVDDCVLALQPTTPPEGG
ncbi:MAG: hypothetical protein R3F61_13260 [Myxococcota bacterium]